MILSRLWIIRKIICVFFFLLIDIILNYDLISCEAFRVQHSSSSSSRNSSKEITNDGLQHTFLSEYIHSVLNKTKNLEEVIYLDLLNNLRNLISVENKHSVNGETNEKAKGKQVEGGGATGQNEKRRKLVNKTNENKGKVFSNSAADFVNEGSVRHGSGNATWVKDPDYLLGYSGNPFGSPFPGRQIPGVVEVSEDDPAGRGFSDPRRKRSVLHLYNMVLCTTGCNPFAYKGYGCYCGFLGSGYVVDGIDSCCKMHDWCYNSAGCPMFLEYFIPYLWKCYHHQPLCAIDHGQYGGPGSCAQRLCECDRQLALCLRRYPCPSTKAFCTSSPWRLLQNVLTL